MLLLTRFLLLLSAAGPWTAAAAEEMAPPPHPPLLCEDPATNALVAVVDVLACPVKYRPAHTAAVNIFDSWWVSSSGMDTCCNATGGPATRSDAVAALRLAKANGVRVFRFFANLWGPNCAFAVEQPERYWAEFDWWWDEVEDIGLHAIPSLGSGDWYLATDNSETLNDLVRNATSVSRQLNARYLQMFVQRYGGRPSLLFWELGNELNLHVDLGPPRCAPTVQCFNTAEMAAYQAALGRAIRDAEARSGLQPRPISSGFAAPRPTAWHQANFPLGSPQYWQKDNNEQWLNQLALQHGTGLSSSSYSPDIWSIHLYDDATGSRNASRIVSAAARARRSGRMLFIGEHGGAGPNFTGPNTAVALRFPRLVLDAQVSDYQSGGTLTLSAIWAWACPSHRRDMVCIWPGEPDGGKENGTQAALAMLADANRRLGG